MSVFVKDVRHPIENPDSGLRPSRGNDEGCRCQCVDAKCKRTLSGHRDTQERVDLYVTAIT